LREGPRKESFPCNVAPGAAGAAPAEIWRGPAAGLAGDVRGVVLGWLGAGLGRSWGRRWPAARRAAAPSGGSRCGLNSGEVWAGEKEWSGSVASLGARECGGSLLWLPVGWRLELTAAGPNGAGGDSVAVGRAGAPR
jgi:hypothetical protein